MDSILAGVSRFQSEVYPQKKELFDRLAHTQTPRVLFLTCSDSRIDPNLITQTGPGDLFVCRNIGNIAPPHGAADRSVATVVEYAVQALGVEHIVLCGHSGCGAMKGLLNPSSAQGLPLVGEWLKYADAARRVTAALHSEQSGEELLRLTAQANVAVQLTHLRTYPEVAARLENGKLALHGWYYDIGSGQIDICGQNGGVFTRLKSGLAAEAPSSGRPADFGREA